MISCYVFWIMFALSLGRGEGFGVLVSCVSIIRQESLDTSLIVLKASFAIIRNHLKANDLTRGVRLGIKRSSRSG